MPHPPPRLHTPPVGRDDVLERIRHSLVGDGPSVVYVQGIGGIGKTTVLRAVTESLDGDVHWFDALGLPDDVRDLATLASSGTVVVDGLEQVPGIAETVRREVVPRLPPGARLLLASREVPSARWTGDLGAQRFLLVRLEGLADPDARSLLEHWGVTPDATLLDLCDGHPLMLVLAAQLPEGSSLSAYDLDRAPDLVVALVEALGAVPTDPVLRQAVTVCAIARRTTEPLLRSVLGIDDAHGVFEALGAQHWVQRDADGVYPHDLVRNAQRAEAKWRDRERYDALFGTVAELAIDRVRREGTAGLADVVFLLADNALYGRIAAHRHVTAGPAVRTTDTSLVPRFFEPHYGPAHAARVLRWFEAGRLALYTLDGPDGSPTELMPVLDDSVLLAPEPTGDPIIDTARRLVTRLNLRAGSRVCVGLGACNLDAGLTDPLGNARTLVAALRMGLGIQNLQALVSVVHPAELWRPMLERNPSITVFEEVEDDGRRFLVQLQDLRVLDIAGWLQTQLYPPPMGPMDIEMLDQDEFGHAVRDALRALASPEADALDACRLARTPGCLRIARTAAVTPARALRTLLVDAIEGVHDARSRAALEKVYVKDAPKQFAAAAELGLSFGTFRRALSHGVEQLTDALWRNEVRATRP
ncbi:MAG: ATP-binding protein [Myxococcota bacterium]